MRWTRPIPLAVAAGAAADATRSRSALLLENALLRHQLVVLSRSVKRPRLTAADRGLLVLLASWLRAWAGAQGRSGGGPTTALALARRFPIPGFAVLVRSVVRLVLLPTEPPAGARREAERSLCGASASARPRRSRAAAPGPVLLSTK